MALVDATKMMASYINDFGEEIKNLPVKFTAEAIIPDGFYQDREEVTRCGSTGNLFKPRRLIATFEFGIHEYPIANVDNLESSILALKQAGAICIDLKGETWKNVPKGLINSPTFKTEPYPIEAVNPDGSSDPNSVNGSGDSESGEFVYNSDISSIGAVILRYSIEEKPANLHEAMLDCLQDAKETEPTYCTAGSVGIRGRYFIVKAAVGTKNTLARQAKISNRQDIKDCGELLAVEAYCLGYKGESIKNVNNLVSS